MILCSVFYQAAIFFRSELVESVLWDINCVKIKTQKISLSEGLLW